MNRWQETDSRRCALDFILRYWGLGVMNRERALAHLPVLEFSDRMEADDELPVED